ncbi:MAG: PrgI family protein [Candidatus Beckwithbacteria bacterium]|nr:PrgI family protein [Candidatus Beckwithbacteria bacterium]
MQQHAVPQSITTYKFRLVGDMTLKQFLELAFGLLLAWLIFSSQINFLFKWTLAPFFALFGFALAFVPFEDRPLDLWLLNFFTALFRPTQFIYRLQSRPLDIFSPNPPPPPEPNLKTSQPGDVAEYLKTLPSSPTTAFDLAESRYLEHVTSLFGALGFSPTALVIDDRPQPSAPFKSPVKGIRVRKLLTPQMCLLPHAVIFTAPQETKQAAIPSGTVKPMPIKAKIITPPSGAEALAKAPKVAARPFVKPVLPRNKTVSEVGPTFATGIVLPHVPDKPNLIAGITLDKAGKIVANVIIEIRDKQNLPVRAFKSNKLGQFFIATPLTDGVYQIQAEQDNQKFAIIKLEAKGEIIPPLKIQAI